MQQWTRSAARFRGISIAILDPEIEAISCTHALNPLKGPLNATGLFPMGLQTIPPLCRLGFVSTANNSAQPCASLGLRHVHEPVCPGHLRLLKR